MTPWIPGQAGDDRLSVVPAKAGTHPASSFPRKREPIQPRHSRESGNPLSIVIPGHDRESMTPWMTDTRTKKPLASLAYPTTHSAMNRLWTWLFWGTCIAVAILSLAPGQYLPPVAFTWWDKAQHAVAFLILAALGLAAYANTPVRLLAGLLAFGALIEVAQWATGWRYGDWQDWVADAVGVAAGLGVWRLITTAIKRL